MGFKRVLIEIVDELQALKSTGIQTVFDNGINSRRAWSLEKKEILGLGASESLSDTNTYLSLVKLSTLDESYFSKFKANKEYRKVLEHVSRGFGQNYWEIINRYASINSKLTNFITADFCSPYRFTYPGIGRVSSTNLRYAKIALDLEKLFGSTEILTVIEVGVGYGGQAVAINELNGFASYRLVDLPEVQKLAQKYVKTFYPSILHKISNTSENWDLLISNYAFSELSREIQEDYMKKYIKKSKRGYVIFNDITDNQFSTFSISEFIESIPGAEILNEFPLTYPRNKLVVWGHSTSDALIQE
jgi:hypothetical protein